MKRKNIAVCVSGFEWTSESEIINGIKKTANAQNINVLVFDSIFRKSNFFSSDSDKIKNILLGEDEIFNLINYRMIDGLILLSDSIFSEDVIQKIQKSCEKNKIPLVNINDITRKFSHNVIIQNKDAMELVVDHLITVHKAKNINFISGFPGNKESEDRLAAYRKILAKYNIPYEEDRVGYGNFYKQAVDVTKEFLNTKKKIDAIVCANDSMAIYVTEFLLGRGIKVPEDIIVTGFDGIKSAFRCKPSITTVTTEYEKLGREAVKLILNLLNNGSGKETVAVKSKLVVQESCGCVKNKAKEDMYELQNRGENLFTSFSNNLSRMNSLCASAEDTVTIFKYLMSCNEVFDFKTVAIFLCSELEKGKGFFYSDIYEDKKYGLSNKMISVLQWGHCIPLLKEFKTSEMIPSELWNREDPLRITFNPLYFKDKFLGYIAYEFNGGKEHPHMFMLWLQSLATNIGSFYEKRELENLYMHDPLTGLYNRSGMNKLYSKVFAKLKEEKGYVTVVCSDIDRLKRINDRYGHEAGDIAIKKVADALKNCFPKQSICVRTGGDEYSVLIHTKSKPDILLYERKLRMYFEKFNKTSGLPFRINSSCGYCTSSYEKEPSLGSMLRVADEELYKAKKNRS